MNKEELQQRIQIKIQEREQHLANANAAQGAITELSAWLNKLQNDDISETIKDHAKPKRGRPKANDYPKDESDGA